MKPPYSRTVFELLCEKGDAAPQRAAAIAAGAQLTYAELADRAWRVAAHMRARGVRRGDRVGLLSNNRIEWLEIFFGAAALGAIVVPISTWSTASELEFLLNDSQVRWLFAMERFAERAFIESLLKLIADGKLALLENVVSIDGHARNGIAAYAEIAQGDSRSPIAPGDGPSAADTLVILYTSGSSDRPKAVPLNQFAAIENGFNIGERQGLVPDDRVLVSIPLFWAYGAVNALPAVLSHGATLVLQSHFEAAGALELIERYRCTAIYTLPAITNALVAHPAFRRERTASLRTGVTIGAPQDIIKTAQELGATHICNIYGGTENYGNCCVTPHDWPLERRAASQGPQLPGVSMRIRDPVSGELVSAGAIGEIEVRGYLTAGYAGASARLNAEAFTRDGYFRTGDLGSLDETGALHFCGRSSEMIKRSGINVSPAEVENALLLHADIAMAGVTGVADAGRGEIIVAYVTAKPGHAIACADVLAHCHALLSRYKIPERLIITDHLPLTVTGKLMRLELKHMATIMVDDEARAQAGDKPS